MNFTREEKELLIRACTYAKKCSIEEFDSLINKLSSDDLQQEKPEVKIYDDEIILFSNLVNLLRSNSLDNNIIGKKVILYNKESSSLYWIIIDINHDGTQNTIDLRSDDSAIEPTRFGYKHESNNYEKSHIRTYLNTVFYEGFDENIKELMKPMVVLSNGRALKDKVKLFSMTELGFDNYHSDIVKNEGQYYIYANNYFLKYNNEPVYQMTRSADTSCLNSIWSISDNGNITISSYCKDKLGACPVIRLSL